MAEISIDFLLGNGLSSRAIAWFGFGAGGYSHCAGVLADGRYLDAREDWVGVTPPGVHIRDPKQEISARRERWTLSVTQTEYDDWEGNLRAKIGDPYAKIAIFGFISGRREIVTGQYTCSMLQVNALQHIKRVVYPLPFLAHQISPNVVLCLMAQIGARQTFCSDAPIVIS